MTDALVKLHLWYSSNFYRIKVYPSAVEIGREPGGDHRLIATDNVYDVESGAWNLEAILHLIDLYERSKDVTRPLSDLSKSI